MFIRILGGGALLLILFGVIFFAPVWALPLVIGLLSAIGVHEMLAAFGIVRDNLRVALYAMLVAILLPMWTYFVGAGDYGILLAMFLLALLLFIEGIIGSKGITFERICITFFAGLAIPCMLSSIMHIIELGDTAYIGRLLLLCPLLGAWGSDVFAYLFGRAFGKHKLAPEISPKKTIEGSIGGFVMAPVVLVLYTLLLDFVLLESCTFNYGSAVLIGVASAFAGQIGDLALSYVKRQAKIKDFGKLIPGHGGVLDRFDSVLFTAPMVELLLVLFPIML